MYVQDQICGYYGYNSEEHNVTTEDGYILTVFRCNSRRVARNGKVVIFQHGILGSSDDASITPPGQGLGDYSQELIFNR